MKKFKIAIAEDHTFVRKGMVNIVKSFPFVSEVLEAENGKELINLIKHDLPEVILMDLNMPVMDGIEASEHILHKYPNVKIIAISMYDEEKYILHMIELGVHGYLLKNTDPEEVEKAILAVVEKDFYHNELVVNVMRKGLIRKSDKPTFHPKIELTTREKQVLKLICNEQTNKEIGDLLCVSPRTIEKIRGNLLEKVGAKNTIGLVKYAIEMGLDI